MELKNNSEVLTIKRPWQGTVLGIFSILALGFSILSVVLSVFVLSGISGLPGYFSRIQDMALTPQFFYPGMLRGLILQMIIFGIPFGILQFYVIKAIFAGRRWAVILLLVFTALSLFSYASPYYLSLFWRASYFLILCFLLYLEIVLVQHPFYKPTVQISNLKEIGKENHPKIN